MAVPVNVDQPNRWIWPELCEVEAADESIQPRKVSRFRIDARGDVAGETISKNHAIKPTNQGEARGQRVISTTATTSSPPAMAVRRHRPATAASNGHGAEYDGPSIDSPRYF